MKRLVLGREYSIGIYSGRSPLELAPAPGAQNPVITRGAATGLLATYVADPFLVRDGRGWAMFFEVVAWRPGSKKGEIAYATSADGLAWRYAGIALAEPFHLSYPHVFTSGSDHWMVPESSQARAVRLYRADPFPARWTFVKELVSGGPYVDSCVFEHEGAWWMLTTSDEALGTLRLFHAPELLGPWTEHPRSPVVRADLRTARSAGRVVSASGRLLRFAQDCRDGYGASVRALEIVRLTPTEFEQRDVGPDPLLGSSRRGWNALGMHHVDAHRLDDGSWIACVDGWTERVRRPREIARWAADRLRLLARAR